MLTFVSKLAEGEMRHMLQLMLRGIVPADRLNAASSATGIIIATADNNTSSAAARWYDFVDTVVRSLDANELDSVAWERQIGFLHLLQPVVRILGFSITSYVPVLHRVMLVILNHAQNCRTRNAGSTGDAAAKDAEPVNVDEDDDNDEDDNKEAVALKWRDETQALRVRSLCLLRIAGMLVHATVSIILFDSSFL